MGYERFRGSAGYGFRDWLAALAVVGLCASAHAIAVPKLEVLGPDTGFQWATATLYNVTSYTNGDTTGYTFAPYTIDGVNLVAARWDFAGDGLPDLVLQLVDPVTGAPLAAPTFAGVTNTLGAGESYTATLAIDPATGEAVGFSYRTEIAGTGITTNPSAFAFEVDAYDATNYKTGTYLGNHGSASTATYTGPAAFLAGTFFGEVQVGSGDGAEFLPAAAGFFLGLNTLLVPGDPPSVTFSSVGVGLPTAFDPYNPPATLSTVRTPVPEPASALLAAFALGSAALAVRHRRRI